MLFDTFDRFAFSGLSLLVLKNETAEGVERDLEVLGAAPDLDERERARRAELLELFRTSTTRDPIEFTTISMSQRRWAT